MKCPHCGRWNRDTFPRCFSCGAELPRPGEGTEKSWQDSGYSILPLEIQNGALQVTWRDEF